MTFQLLEGVTNPMVMSTTDVNDTGIDWFYVVAMRTLTTGVHGTDGLRIYIDAGAAEDTVALAASFDSSNSNELEVGDAANNTGSGLFTINFWHGPRSHTAVYDYALSDAQIQAHFDAMT
jgi:hypothetical protein